MKNIINEINKEYSLVEASLNKLYKSIFIIGKSENIIEHEMMELSVLLENLGISINELDENIK